MASKAKTNLSRIRRFVSRNGIRISIFVVFGLILAGAALTYYNRRVMEHSNVLVRETQEVLAQVDATYDNIKLMDISSRGYALIRQPEFLFWSVATARSRADETFVRLDSLFKRQGFFNPKNYSEMKKGIYRYVDLYAEMVDHLNKNEMDQYLAQLKADYGKEFWYVFSPFKESVVKFEQQREANAKESYDTANMRNNVVQALLVVLGLPTLLWLLYKLNKDARDRRKLLLDLEENNKQYLFNDGTENKRNEKAILANSITNLQRASNFVTQISQGNYKATWEGLSEGNVTLNKENLAGKLMFMREEMIRVKEEESKRSWANEGLSEFSEIIRKHQNDLDDLANRALTFLVKYMKAQQGSMFTLLDQDGDDPHLELVSCYAFDRKKYLHKRIRLGEGLLGQTYLEGRTMVLKRVPKDYVTITSGLGDATPSCVIIVPMRHNEEVKAIVELATFSEFKPYQIAFLEKAGEFVASAITAAQNNTRNREIMEQLKSQTEQMKSQEEELRQNLEEMEATQEEMRRKEVAFEKNSVELS